MRAEGNIFRDIPFSPAEEETLSILSTRNLRIERIVSTGQASAEGFWYEQKENEWIVVLRGRGVIEYEDGSLTELGEGDWLHIPARLRHRVKETSSDRPTVWLAVFHR